MSILKDTKLSNAVSNFAEEMRLRFAAKEQEGFSGWDSRENVDDTDLLEKIEEDLASPTGVRLIDIANRAMILWYREKYT